MSLLTETSVTPAVPAGLTGLTEAEAARALAARGPFEAPPTSRSYASIVRANVFTIFNLILAVLGILTLVFANPQDALFLGILVANTGIGITQEVRAKRALDRLAALVAPQATVVRDGSARSVGVAELVEGDLVRLEAGDQVVADGWMERSHGLRLDESILTGETRSVPRADGEEIRSGSFAVEGSGYYRVAAVGPDSYAERLAGEAREFRSPRSPLELALNRLLIVLVAVMIPLAAILVYALVARDEPVQDAVETAVAGIGTIVPEGLILLTSLTFAVAALRMARRGALAQQLNAVESLASAQVICLDKTGTLTESSLRVVAFVPAAAGSEDELRRALGTYAASSSGLNATLAAIADACPGSPREVTEEVPFSSRRRWSGLRIGGEGYVLGAPELFVLGELDARAGSERDQGRRVLAFGTTPAHLDARLASDAPPPGGTALLGLVVLSERLRPETAETVEFFRNEGIELKVISGDAPETVAAIARDAGIPVEAGPLDGRTLPDDAEALRSVALAASVVGRISPEGKKRLVEALSEAGRYVAMVGDGVNDVPALKAARLGIAQGSGTQMAKTVADVVLVSGTFSAVPAMVREGRKVLRNLQRVTKLFVAKSAFATFLILTLGLVPIEFPLLPRHLTLAALLTVGIPSFFLALAPSAGAWEVGAYLRDVARFAVPAGTALGLGVTSAYLFAQNVLDLRLVESRTVAVSVLILCGLYLIIVLEADNRRHGVWVVALCGVLLLLYAIVLASSGGREFFDLAVPGLGAIGSILLGTGLAIGGLVLTDERFVAGRDFFRVRRPHWPGSGDQSVR